MIISCTSCGKQLEVDASLAGQQGQCPFCKATITIEAPAAPPPAAVLRPVGSRGPVSTSKIFQILVLVGAGLFFVAFFVPWWGMSTENPMSRSRETFRRGMDPEDYREKEKAEEQREAQRVASDCADWYAAFPSLQKKTRKQLERKSGRLSAWLWGWNTGTGITAFIFSFVIVAVVLLPWFIRFLRPWAWIGEFVAAALAIPMLVLSLVWVFGAPGENVGSLLKQGLIVGPWLILVGALAIGVFATINAVGGITAFVKKLQSSAAAAAPVVAAEVAPSEQPAPAAPATPAAPPAPPKPAKPAEKKKPE